MTRDGTAEPVSRDQILRHARGQGNIHFPCSADHEQDWQPYPVDPYSTICDDHTYPSLANVSDGELSMFWCSLAGADRPPKTSNAGCQARKIGLFVCLLIALSVATVRSAL